MTEPTSNEEHARKAHPHLASPEFCPDCQAFMREFDTIRAGERAKAEKLAEAVHHYIKMALREVSYDPQSSEDRYQAMKLLRAALAAWEGARHG